jgi:threonine/homoserine/homoserine lactone efflux protein
MIPVDHLAAFTITAFVLIVVPGPSVLFVIGRALVLGRRGAFATIVGNAFGEYVQVMAVAFGVGAIVERSIVVYTVIKLAGAAYLIFLGVQAIRHRRVSTEATRPVPDAAATDHPAGLRRALREGFVVGLGNPKSVVFFAAMLPQFIDASSGYVPVQMLALGAVFLLIALVSDSAWAIVASGARAWFARSPRRLSRLSGVGGVVMIGIGARLALSGRPD